MSRALTPSITAWRELRLPILAFAAQKCELQPDNIMIGLLALVAEQADGLAATRLNQVLFAGARLQLAEQMLHNGVATGELSKQGERYFLTEYGHADLRDRKAWVNGQTASWELLCFGSHQGAEVEGILRDLSAREKMQAGWRPLEDFNRVADAAAARIAWEKISQKTQIQVWLEDERKGVLMVDEFAEPPKPTETNKILARLCVFGVTLSRAGNGRWSLAGLEYVDPNDQKYAVPFKIRYGGLGVSGPTTEEWERGVVEAGLELNPQGDLVCKRTEQPKVDYKQMVITECYFRAGAWEVRAENIPLQARDQAEAMRWFAQQLAATSGRSVATWGELKTSAARFLTKAGVPNAALPDAELRLALQEALARMPRGDASRLGYILDFES
jgi:hypothetical protein